MVNIYLPRMYHPEGGYVTKPAIFLRFGRPPQNAGTSFNAFLQRPEKGVSVYLAWYDDKTKKYVLDDAGSSEFGDYVGTQDSLLERALKGTTRLYKVTGTPILATGGDDETLLDPSSVKIEEVISLDDVVSKNEPFITLSGKELGENDQPQWESKPIAPSKKERDLEAQVAKLDEEVANLDQKYYSTAEQMGIEIRKTGKISDKTIQTLRSIMDRRSKLSETTGNMHTRIVGMQYHRRGGRGMITIRKVQDKDAPEGLYDILESGHPIGVYDLYESLISLPSGFQDVEEKAIEAVQQHFGNVPTNVEYGE